jgi:hypothetical protein
MVNLVNNNAELEIVRLSPEEKTLESRHGTSYF